MRVDLVNADDWQALYIDGVKTTEGHRLSAWDVLKTLEGTEPITQANSHWLDDAELEKIDHSFPTLLGLIVNV